MPKAKSRTTSIKSTNVQRCKERIDNYNNTVFAIIGFLNTYVHELKRSGRNVVIFQGRKLYLTKDLENFVTPDLGLAIGEDEGVIGEVKCTLDKDQNNWKDHFEQLKKYEKIVAGWPTEGGEVAKFDVVILVEHSRSRALRDFYEKHLDSSLKLERPFAILEFNRSSQQKEFFFFRIEFGSLSNDLVNNKFYNGVKVAMEVFVEQYSKIKIYDVQPEMPVMLELINQCVVDKLIRESKYRKLTARSSYAIEITVSEITEVLQDVYSFKSLHNRRYHQGQPEYPKSDWIKQAFDVLVNLSEGHWIDKASGKFNYLLTKKKNILEHYIHRTLGESAVQAKMFEL